MNDVNTQLKASSNVSDLNMKLSKTQYVHLNVIPWLCLSLRHDTVPFAHQTRYLLRITDEFGGVIKHGWQVLQERSQYVTGRSFQQRSQHIMHRQ